MSESIDITRAAPGMVLDDDVVDIRGGRLLPAGFALTESALASLQRRGIVRLKIAGPPSPAQPIPAADRIAIEARIAFLFRHGGDPRLRAALHLLRTRSGS